MDKDTKKTTINELLNFLREEKVTQIIDDSAQNRYVKKLSARKYLGAFVIAQSQELDSLNHLALQCQNNEDVQKALSLSSISASQLSRRQNAASPEWFEKIFRELVKHLLARTKPTGTFKNIGKLYAIDASTVSMCLTDYEWAGFKKTKAGVKLHQRVVITEEAVIPDKAVIKPAKHSDRSEMDALIEIDHDAVYLFDRGYNDYKQFDRYCQEGVRFVTRLKKNAIVEVLNEQVPDGENQIFQDAEIFIGKADKKMKHPLRQISTKDSEGNEIVIVTNCFEMSAKEIGDLYRYRWKIETFFKWMKQHLKVKKLFGKGANAVANQIYSALITYCLQVFVQIKYHYDGTLLQLKRLVEMYLFKDVQLFIKALFKKPSRPSSGRRKTRWEEEFQLIATQFEIGDVDIFYDQVIDPVFL